MSEQMKDKKAKKPEDKLKKLRDENKQLRAEMQKIVRINSSQIKRLQTIAQVLQI